MSSYLKVISISVILLSALCKENVYAENIVIIDNGKTNAVIEIGADASTQIKYAAGILQRYIYKSTGVTLAINNFHSASKYSIHIGSGSLQNHSLINISNLDQDGYILQKIDASNYAIVGGSDWGSEFGVYFFLEHFLNIYWLMPYDIGTDVPTSKTLIVDGVKITRNPVFLSRQLSPINTVGFSDGAIWGRANYLHGRIQFQHNLNKLFDPDKYIKTNPIFFPTMNGRRYLPKKGKDYEGQPNFSAPGIVDTAVANIKKYFKDHPLESSYSLSINDSRYFDDSPASNKRRSGKRNYLGMPDVSDDYYTWADSVVTLVTAVFPNKSFGALAYNNVVEPPSKKVGVNSHIIPFITFERMRWSKPEMLRQDQSNTRHWAEMCHNIGWYDYVYGGVYLVPREWPHLLQKYLKWGADNNVKYYYAELYPNWGEGPKGWVITRLLWDPSQNVDDLLDIWYSHYAGQKAGEKLKQFYSIWEKFWTHDINSSSWSNSNQIYLPGNDLAFLGVVPKPYIAQADQLMKEAVELADSPIRKMRVEKLQMMWQLYKLCIQTYQQNSNLIGVGNQSVLNTQPIKDQLNILYKEPLFSLTVEVIRNRLGIN